MLSCAFMSLQNLKNRSNLERENTSALDGLEGNDQTDFVDENRCKLKTYRDLEWD